MSDVLEEIAAKTRKRVQALKQNLSRSELEAQSRARTPKPFANALRRSSGLAIIAELKQASPSAGVIRKETDLAGRIRGYEKGGAAALSILTEEEYFHGSPAILELARKESSLPLLRKDFMLDPLQIDESRAMGADAVLLITTLLDPALLGEMLAHAKDAGLDAMVETHDEHDLEKALKADARCIGVNHRNLRTLQMDMSISRRLLPKIPKDRTVIVESGIHNPAELESFRHLGAHAALIGETLMRDPNAEAIVRKFAAPHALSDAERREGNND
jgi:indole-3-glycerol phosphate synthase